MDFLVMIGQLLLALSILVGVHEFGHMISAKYFGMRVEKFSIGFPPKIFGFKKGETEYSLGAIPLGGFVKITGMIDESLDTEQMSKEPEPHEFRAKPAWQRLIVMMGGIVVNLILGIILFILILTYYGERYYSMEDVNKHGIVAYPIAENIGLQTGDKIIAVNGKDVERFPQDLLDPDVLLGENSYFLVKRNDSTFRLPVPDTLIGEISKRDQAFVSPAYTFSVGKLEEGRPAEKAGLQKGDSIISVDGNKVAYFHQFQSYLKNNKNERISIKVARDSKVQEINVKVDTNGTIGFYPKLYFPRSIENYSLGEAIPVGTKKAFSVITTTVRALGKIFAGKINASDSVAGPIGIMQEFGGEWIWERFWLLTASLSMILAFMNFLPIPALDGGHVMFLLYEMIAGRKPSDKFLEVAQKIGMVLLLALMILVFGNDLYKVFFK